MEKEYITKTSGPCIIFAGAGTGKTHAMVEKVSYILKNKIYSPEKIVCLTFSNEAANSLATRIMRETKEEPLVVRTFHSFCSDLLKKHGNKIGINDFKILLPDDAKILLHKSFKIDPNNCSNYINTIGVAKDLGINNEDLERYVEDKDTRTQEEIQKEIENLTLTLHTLHLKKDENKDKLKERVTNLTRINTLKKFVKAWNSYEKLKERRGFFDYSDLNKYALRLLEKFPEISQEYDYVVVDEFQDTNKLQCDLLERIAPQRNITVVGDLNQSIYRFRGAYKDNLSNFKKAFSVTDKDVFTLDKSYRSTNRILRVAHDLIKNNYENPEECFPVFSAYNEEGNSVESFELKNNKEEARKIMEIIKEEQDKGTPLEEICVMFRTHQQAAVMKNSLDYEQIPYVSVTKKSLLKIPDIKLTVAYLTILSKLKNKDKGGESAWWELIYNVGFSKEDLMRLSRFIKDNKKDETPLSVKMINGTQGLRLSEKGSVKFKILISGIKDLLPNLGDRVTSLILKIYRKAGLNPEEKSKESLVVLERFYSLAEEHSYYYPSDLESFLHHLDVIRALRIEIEAPDIRKEGVRIMTNHATKGLEYNTVIVSGLAQKRFPLESRTNSLLPSELLPEVSHLIGGLSEEDKEIALKKYEEENNLAEERRLCYVAFTRAKRRLVLTYAKEYGSRKFLPSQFLNEINYKENKDIDFKIDNDEKYKEPELKIEEVSAVDAGLRDDNPDFKPENLYFSPSSLRTFDECQKKYEYKYVYNMPDPEPISWDVMQLGLFVHFIVECGVKYCFKTEEDFIQLAKEFHLKEEWNYVNLEEAIPLLKVFYKRNKDKYDSNSMTEKKLFTKIDGLSFIGVADRIDFREDGLEIVDYKTGASNLGAKYRNWQLGFYALAAKSLGRPKRLTLDFLKKERPIEFDLDEKGNANEIYSERTSFNLEEVKEEMLSVARKIIDCYYNGFTPCSVDKNCPFCSEYVY